jgi:hypothetical protein
MKRKVKDTVYRFVPKKDITVQELANVLRMMRLTGDAALVGQLDREALRHWVKSED